MKWVQKLLCLLYDHTKKNQDVIALSTYPIHGVLVLLSTLYIVNQINPLSESFWRVLENGFNYMHFYSVSQYLPIGVVLYIASSIAVVHMKTIETWLHSRPKVMHFTRQMLNLSCWIFRTAVYAALYFKLWHYANPEWLPMLISFLLTHVMMFLAVPKSYSNTTLAVEHFALIFLFNAFIGVADLKQILISSASFLVTMPLYHPVIELGPIYWLIRQSRLID